MKVSMFAIAVLAYAYLEASAKSVARETKS